MSELKPGLAAFLDFLRSTLATSPDGADAFGTHQGMIFSHGGIEALCAFDLPVRDSLRWLKTSATETSEVMLSCDCVAKPDQDLTRDDFCLVFHLHGATLTTLIVEYDRNTREMDAPRFDNDKWNRSAAECFDWANGR